MICILLPLQLQSGPSFCWARGEHLALLGEHVAHSLGSIDPSSGGCICSWVEDVWRHVRPHGSESVQHLQDLHLHLTDCNSQSQTHVVLLQPWTASGGSPEPAMKMQQWQWQAGPLGHGRNRQRPQASSCNRSSHHHCLYILTRKTQT